MIALALFLAATAQAQGGSVFVLTAPDTPAAEGSTPRFTVTYQASDGSTPLPAAVTLSVTVTNDVPDGHDISATYEGRAVDTDWQGSETLDASQRTQAGQATLRLVLEVPAGTTSGAGIALDLTQVADDRLNERREHYRVALGGGPAGATFNPSFVQHTIAASDPIAVTVPPTHSFNEGGGSGAPFRITFAIPDGVTYTGASNIRIAYTLDGSTTESANILWAGVAANGHHDFSIAGGDDDTAVEEHTVFNFVLTDIHAAGFHADLSGNTATVITELDDDPQSWVVLAVDPGGLPSSDVQEDASAHTTPLTAGNDADSYFRVLVWTGLDLNPNVRARTVLTYCIYGTARGGLATDLSRDFTWPDGYDPTADVSSMNGECTAGSGTLTFAAGAGSQYRVPLFLHDDALNEGDETILIDTVSAVSDEGYTNVVEHQFYVDDNSRATRTIKDNDAISVSIAATGPDADSGLAGIQVREGSSAVFTITLSVPSSEAVEVPYTVGGEVIAADYTAPVSPLTIAAGEPAGTLTIPLAVDADFGNESLTVTLDTGGYTAAGAIARSTAVAEQSATVAVVSTPYARTLILTRYTDSARTTVAAATTVTETDADLPLYYTIGLVTSDTAFSVPTTVMWTVNHGAPPTVADDFVGATTGSIVFPAGDVATTFSFTVTLNGDTFSEANEQFTVSLSVAEENADGGTFADDATITMTITDNDAIAVAVPPTHSFNEGDSANAPFRITFTIPDGVTYAGASDIRIAYTLDGAPAESANIPWAGVAANGYHDFSAGSGSADNTAEPHVVSNLVLTGIEPDFNADLSSNTAIVITELDDDPQSWVVLAVDPGGMPSSDVQEDASAHTTPLTAGNAADSYFRVLVWSGVTLVPNVRARTVLTYCIYGTARGGFAGDAARDFTWPDGYDPTADVSSIKGDCTAGSGTLTFAAGDGSQYRVPLFLHDDGLNEGDETILIDTVSAVSDEGYTNVVEHQFYVGVNSHATRTIKDNDAISVSIAATGPDANSRLAGIQVREGSSAVFTITLSVPSSEAVEVPYTVGGEVVAADYTAPVSPLTIAAGETIGTLAIPLAVDDDTASEDLTVTLDTVGYTAAGDIARSTAVAEQSATVGVIIPPAVRTLTLTRYTDSARTTMATSTGVTETDADLPLYYTIGLAAGGTPFSDPTTVVWTVNHATPGTDNDDFVGATTGSVVFPADNTTATFDFVITIAGDRFNETSEQFTVHLSAADAAADGGTSDDVSTITIAASDPIAITVPPAHSFNEGASADTPFRITFAIPAGVTYNGASDIRIAYTLDGAAAESANIPWAGVAANGYHDFSIGGGASDTALELHVVYNFLLTGIRAAGFHADLSGNTAMIISELDDDSRAWVMTSRDGGQINADLAESASPIASPTTNGSDAESYIRLIGTGAGIVRAETVLTYCLYGSARGGVAGDAARDYTWPANYDPDADVSNIHSDCANGSGFVTVAAGGASIYRVGIPLNDDSLNEGDETIRARIVTATIADGYLVRIGNQFFNADLGTDFATRTIQDNDAIRVSIAAAGPDADADLAGIQAREGSNAVFTITLSVPSSEAVEVPYTIGGEVVAADYTAPVSPLTIVAGETAGALAIPLTVDADTASEDLTVTLDTVGYTAAGAIARSNNPAEQSATVGVILPAAIRTLTLTRYTDPARTTVAADTGITETDADLSLYYTLGLATGDTAFSVPTTVMWTVSHGAPATDSDDFVGATTGSVVFPAGNTTATFDFVITIAGDRFNEANEQFTIHLSVADRDADGGTNAAAVVMTITDNDAIAVTVPPTHSFNEDDSTGAPFRITFAIPAGVTYNGASDIRIAYTLDGAPAESANIPWADVAANGYYDFPIQPGGGNDSLPELHLVSHFVLTGIEPGFNADLSSNTAVVITELDDDPQSWVVLAIDPGGAPSSDVQEDASAHTRPLTAGNAADSYFRVLVWTGFALNPAVRARTVLTYCIYGTARGGLATDLSRDFTWPDGYDPTADVSSMNSNCTAGSGTLTFAAGAGSQYRVPLFLHDDALNEGDETIIIDTVSAVSDDGYTNVVEHEFYMGVNSYATRTIKDNDTITVSVSVTAPADTDSVAAGHQVREGVNAVFNVELSGALATPATFAYTISGDVEAADYVDRGDGLVTIAAGTTRSDVRITILADADTGVTETLTVSLGDQAGQSASVQIVPTALLFTARTGDSLVEVTFRAAVSGTVRSGEWSVVDSDPGSGNLPVRGIATGGSCGSDSSATVAGATRILLCLGSDFATGNSFPTVTYRAPAINGLTLDGSAITGEYNAVATDGRVPTWVENPVFDAFGTQVTFVYSEPLADLPDGFQATITPSSGALTPSLSAGSTRVTVALGQRARSGTQYNLRATAQDRADPPNVNTESVNTVFTYTPASSTIAITAGPDTIDEAADNTTATDVYTIVRRGPEVAFAVTATWEISHAATTGTEAADFLASTGTVRYVAGESTQSFTILAVADAVSERDEHFTLTVSAPFHNAGPAWSGTINENGPNEAFILGEDMEVSEGDDFRVRIGFRGVRRPSTATVGFTITGAAQAGADYEVTTSTVFPVLTFDPASGTGSVQTTGGGHAVAEIPIRILEDSDSVQEGPETLIVTLNGTLHRDVNTLPRIYTIRGSVGLPVRIRLFLEGAVIP